MPILPFLLHLGDFYLAWGKKEKAIEAYKKKVDAQIKAFPRNPFFYFSGAIPYLKEASEKIPDNPIVRYHLGMAYYKSDKKEMAKKELTAALRMDPKFTGADKAKAALEALK